MDAKISLVNFLRPCRFVGEQLAGEGSFGKCSACDWHRSPVGFKEEMHALVLAAGIGKFQSEHAIWDDTESRAVLNSHPPSEWLAFQGKRQLVFVNDFDAAMFSAGQFNRHHHVGNQECVFKIYPANHMVFLAPRNAIHGDAKLLLQQRPPFIS